MKPFYKRLKEYYQKNADVLKGTAQISSIFPNTSDIGHTREQIYAEFLMQHLPSKCTTFLGGFLFGEKGEESKQIDIIVSTDTTPQYNFFKKDGLNKSFSPVDGCLAIASIKSNLTKKELIYSLENIASVPDKGSLEGKLNPNLKINNYDDWPYKIIYASDGLNGKTVLTHIEEFYIKNSSIPINKRPNIIHVIGKYVIFKIATGAKSVSIADGTETTYNIGGYHLFETNSDIQAISWVLQEIQRNAVLSSHILFSYDYLLKNILMEQEEILDILLLEK